MAIEQKIRSGIDREGSYATYDNGLSRAVAPIHFITDFNNQLSSVECEQAVRAVFEKEGVIYESPHTINDVQPFNIIDGAFKIHQLVNNQRRASIPGIFIGVVDPGVGSQRRGIVVQTREGYTFVGPDNGLFSPSLATLTPTLAYKINERAFASSSATFHGRDQFTPVAAGIASGKHPSQLPQLEEITPDELTKREFAEGQVVEKDGYGNLKIWQKGIPTDSEGRRARHGIIRVPGWFRDNIAPWPHSIKIQVAHTFEDVAVGKWLMYEGSSNRTEDDNRGLVEIAVREGAGKDSAAGRLRAKIGDVLKLSWSF